RRGPSACLHQNDERGERRSTTAPRRAHNSMELRSFAPSALETDDVDVGPGGLDRAAAPGVTQGLAVRPAGAAAADGVGDAAGREVAELVEGDAHDPGAGEARDGEAIAAVLDRPESGDGAGGRAVAADGG